MSKERMYGWNGEYPSKELGGQCKVVFDHLRSEPDVLRTGHQWSEAFGHQLRTKQDPYRVILYYIIILKADGVIRTNEFDINAVTKTAECLKHGITVKTQATIDERYSVLEPQEVDEPTIPEYDSERDGWEGATE